MNALHRAIRTFAQTAIGIFLALVIPATEGVGVPTYDVVQSALVAALWGGFLAVLTWGHNALEDVSGRNWLKD